MKTEVTIDSLGGLGDGIGRLVDKPVFVPKSCAGDTVEINILNDLKEHARAQIVGVITSGPDRIAAPCRHFSQCGGCGLQHITPDAYKNFKRMVLANALAHGGFPEVKADIAFLPAASRRRVEFKTVHNAAGLSLAYHGLASHERVAISECLILTPSLQALLTPLRTALNKLPFAAQIDSVSLTEADSGIDLLLGLKQSVSDSGPALKILCEQLGLARVSAFVGEGKPRLMHEAKPVEIQFGDYRVPLPQGAFLQAAAEGQKQLTDFVLAHIGETSSVADLFAGVGTYSYPVSALTHVHAVEVHNASHHGLRAGIGLHNLYNNISTEARDLFKRPYTAKELIRFDAVIINPPRAGAKAQVEEIAKSKLKKVIMISCNPGSFSRDAKILKNAGFSLSAAQGVDQFVWSPHLEIAALFIR